MNDKLYFLSASKPGDEIDLVVAWDNSTPPEIIWVKDNINLRPAKLSAAQVMHMISSNMIDQGYDFYPRKAN